MTDKAQKIIDAMKKRKIHGLSDPKTRERFLDQFNQSTLDPVGPVGGKGEMKVLNEMNAFVDEHERYVKSLKPRVGAC